VEHNANEEHIKNKIGDDKSLVLLLRSFRRAPGKTTSGDWPFGLSTRAVARFGKRDPPASEVDAGYKHPKKTKLQQPCAAL